MDYTIVDWAKPSFEARLQKHMMNIGKLPDVSAARFRQINLQGQLQDALPEDVYSLLLDYEGVINERFAMEFQYLYWSGIRDGLRFSEAYRACTADQE